MEAKVSKEFKNSETLFKSTDQSIVDEYVEFWESAFASFIQSFKDAKVDGTEDSLRCRMLAAMRLAQFGLSMFSFFSSCAMSIQDGEADVQACNATGKVVSMVVEGKTEGWITKAKKALS